MHVNRRRWFSGFYDARTKVSAYRKCHVRLLNGLCQHMCPYIMKATSLIPIIYRAKCRLGLSEKLVLIRNKLRPHAVADPKTIEIFFGRSIPTPICNCIHYTIKIYNRCAGARDDSNKHPPPYDVIDSTQLKRVSWKFVVTKIKYGDRPLKRAALPVLQKFVAIVCLWFHWFLLKSVGFGIRVDWKSNYT